jgi:ribosomal-protein-alanine N-acetyltransferase
VALRLASPRRSDRAEFLELVHASTAFHRPWTYPPSDAAGFRRMLERNKRDDYDAQLLRREDDDAIVGIFELSGIMRGFFHSAYLGYWVGEPFARQGYMTEGMRLLLRHAFGELRLHRVEANIQPGNEPSLALARTSGFRREGFSPRYLKIGGRWRDHERWAILADDWRSRPPDDRRSRHAGGRPAHRFGSGERRTGG